MRFLLCLLASMLFAAPVPPALTVKPFGAEFPNLDSLATGAWWEPRGAAKGKKKGAGPSAPPTMLVERDQVIAFALYTQQDGVLKLSAQLYPLYPDESKEVRLEFKRDGRWVEAAKAEVVFPGWSAHFRVTGWDGSKDVAYRVRHGEKAAFEGLVRRDPTDKETIVVANMSCNSSRTTGARPEILDNLIRQNPDLLFFAGDQTYRHTEHTAGWIEFGLQFREVMKDRPTICIPDDHDVGHPNLWGEDGKLSTAPGNADGGYMFPVAYVNMVQRQQSWHLPDAFDPTPVQRGISVYYTRLKVGGMDFAILEDRKFKSGPLGKIPQQGPRPDHVTDEKYDPKSIDLPGLQLLGERQLKFLAAWSADWVGVRHKAVLSATAFCGAVHMHGKRDDRLLADLDCNGWPQKGRDEALRALRRVQAVHLCGDQHLAVTIKHGIEAFGDGPYALTSPALVNTIYGRWWHPKDEKPGPNAVAGSPLPWTGDFLDGLGNRMSVLAYANPGDIQDERQRADGYGVAKFQLSAAKVTFECWPRFSDASKGDAGQFPGWPQTFRLQDNDGRKPTGTLPAVDLSFAGDRAVVQIIHEQTGETVYFRRLHHVSSFTPPVFAAGSYTVKVGVDRPDARTLTGQQPVKR
ncbi:MAG: hypothetical protein RLZZ552_323 [Verrucomicrobiota bacterium]